MNETFFRVILENPNTNYYFLCGGTVEELRTHLCDQDKERDDGKSCVNVLDIMVRALQKNGEKDFVAITFDNGLEFMLLRASEPAPINEASAADMALWLKTLITKENNKPNDSE